MLTTLRLKNLAIIDELELSFAPGLNVISGETGAGKSIIVGALGLLLGAKAQAELVRAGCEEAEVEALFEAAEAELPEGLDLDGASEFTLRRAVSAKGRSRTWLNLRLCPTAVAAGVACRLVSICSQHEHQGLLLNPASHLDILDRAGGLLLPRAEAAEAYAEMVRAHRDLEAARRAAASTRERAELLGFQVSEIEAANLSVGEDEELEAERGVLRSAERLLAEAGEAYQHLYEGEGAAVARLGLARRRLEESARLDPRLEEVLRQVEGALIQAEEAARALGGYLEGLQPDPARLERVEERLAAIRALKRKYGATIADVLAFGHRAKEELAALEQMDERLSELEAELTAARQECHRFSRDLSYLRAEAAEIISRVLTLELHQVGMPQAEFRIRVDKLPPAADGDPFSWEGGRLTERGRETATFLLAPNPGEGFKPLAHIASGGELSRVMLCLKKVMAAAAETLVFDEVDAGLGGAVAEVVGRKLKELSRKQQVICITHLPQIACFADRHLKVAKEVAGGRTLTRVAELSEAERLEEVARMLGGVKVTEKARQHAREMIRGAGVESS